MVTLISISSTPFHAGLYLQKSYPGKLIKLRDATIFIPMAIYYFDIKYFHKHTNAMSTFLSLKRSYDYYLDRIFISVSYQQCF